MNELNQYKMEELHTDIKEILQELKLIKEQHIKQKMKIVKLEAIMYTTMPTIFIFLTLMHFQIL